MNILRNLDSVIGKKLIRVNGYSRDILLLFEGDALIKMHIDINNFEYPEPTNWDLYKIGLISKEEYQSRLNASEEAKKRIIREEKLKQYNALKKELGL